MRHYLEAQRYDGKFTLSSGVAVSRDEARKMYRAGDLADGLRFNAVVFTNGKNKNHFRFPDGEMESFASSFVDRPFLKDHEYLQDNVGGTIVASRYEDGKMHQVIEAVKPWALEGILDKTIKTFSIGWDSEKAICTACEKPIMSAECDHMPWDLGTTTKDGKLVEVRFESNEGIETSAVVNPAAPGTGVEILKAMSQKQPRRDVPVLGIEEVPMHEWLVKLLGVPPETDEAGLQRALEAKLAATIVPAVILSALGLKPEATADEAAAAALKLSMPGSAFVAKAEHEKTVARVRELEADIAVDKLLREGRITPDLVAWAKKQALEAPDAFKAWAASAPVVTPVAVVVPAIVADDARPANVANVTPIEEHIQTAMGVTKEQSAEADKRIAERRRAQGRG